MKNNYIKHIIFSFLILFPSFSFAVDLESVNGIWKQVVDPEFPEVNVLNGFYSIHQDGKTIILIDLTRLENTSNSLSSAYSGSVDDFVLTPMALYPDNITNPGGLDSPMKIAFDSEKEATIIFIAFDCGNCIAFPVKLKKVFKDLL